MGKLDTKDRFTIIMMKGYTASPALCLQTLQWLFQADAIALVLKDTEDRKKGGGKQNIPESLGFFFFFFFFVFCFFSKWSFLSNEENAEEICN